jgi:hypothetical protein
MRGGVPALFPGAQAAACGYEDNDAIAPGKHLLDVHAESLLTATDPLEETAHTIASGEPAAVRQVCWTPPVDALIDRTQDRGNVAPGKRVIHASHDVFWRLTHIGSSRWAVYLLVQPLPPMHHHHSTQLPSGRITMGEGRPASALIGGSLD